MFDEVPNQDSSILRDIQKSRHDMCFHEVCFMPVCLVVWCILCTSCIGICHCRSQKTFAYYYDTLLMVKKYLC